MWIFTIVAAIAVVGTVIWLDWPRWKAWATNTGTRRPQHRATDKDITYHADVLIARLEEELIAEAQIQIQTIEDWVHSVQDTNAPADWPVMVSAPAESIDDIESVHGTGDGNWYSIRTGELVVAAPAGFSERGE